MLDKNSIASDDSSVNGAESFNLEALAQLYTAHIGEKHARFQTILADSHYQAIVIASGGFNTQYQDDLFYPFNCNMG